MSREFDLLRLIVCEWDAGGEWVRGEFEDAIDEARRFITYSDDQHERLTRAAVSPKPESEHQP